MPYTDEDFWILKTLIAYDDGIESYFTTEVPKCFQQRQHRWAKCRAAQGGTSKVTSLSKLQVYRYEAKIRSFRGIHSHTS